MTLIAGRRVFGAVAALTTCTAGAQSTIEPSIDETTYESVWDYTVPGAVHTQMYAGMINAIESAVRRWQPEEIRDSLAVIRSVLDETEVQAESSAISMGTVLGGTGLASELVIPSP